MDNACITCNNEEELQDHYEKLPGIFKDYQFELQQFVTNGESLQAQIDEQMEEETPVETKLLGLKYDRKLDKIYAEKLYLSPQADTKRKILSSIATNFDLFQYSGPLLNRARLYMHRLQCMSGMDWDSKLNNHLLKEWKNISSQVNKADVIPIERYVGDRSSSYRLVAFVDASSVMIAVVIYIQEIGTNKVSFLLSKNKIVGKQLEKKSIPALELTSGSFGVETLLDIYQELSGQKSVSPINIKELVLYSDSTTSLQWIDNHVNKLEKINQKSTYVKNRLESIRQKCALKPIQFRFIAGNENPADIMTRPISYKQLIKSNYHSGPELFATFDYNEVQDFSFMVPNTNAKEVHPEDFTNVEPSESNILHALIKEENVIQENIVPTSKVSSFGKLVRVMKFVFQFIRKLKSKLRNKEENLEDDDDLHRKAYHFVLKTEQKTHYPAVIEYFRHKRPKKDMPNIVGQLNLFKDADGILRVRGKFKNWSKSNQNSFPILLPNKGRLIRLLVNDLHKNMYHSGVFSVLNQLRKGYHVPKPFITVKMILNDCVTCKKQNSRPVKTNQSYYRDFRIDPSTIPFRDLYMDHFGPYNVRNGETTSKVWILCLTCAWSRAINLQISYDMTVAEFLRAFQLHTFKHGMPARIYSDAGSSLVAGGILIKDFLRDVSSQLYLEENNIKSIEFNHFEKGKKELASMVEIVVKLCKKLISSTIGKNVLSRNEFDYVISQANHMVNKRPVAFKECLYSNVNELPEIVDPITPEMILRGHELPLLSTLPESSNDNYEPNVDSVSRIRENFDKLSQVRHKLIKCYHEEFLSKLMYQSINQKDRYSVKNHHPLKIGDIVLLKEDNTKRINYPLAIVRNIIQNDLGETTTVTVMKGKNRELVKRHVNAVIPILSPNNLDSLEAEETSKSDLHAEPPSLAQTTRKLRKSAEASRAKTMQLMMDNLA